MPVAGRKPKEEGQARHRVKPVHSWTEVPDLPYTGRKPRLPRRRSGPWPSRAKRKWEVWSSMPHCALWTKSEWEYALDALELFARFEEGDRAAATELRSREKVMGTTADYRRDLRIRYVDPDPQDGAPAEEPAPDVANMADYRDLGDLYDG